MISSYYSGLRTFLDDYTIESGHFIVKNNETGSNIVVEHEGMIFDQFYYEDAELERSAIILATAVARAASRAWKLGRHAAK